MEYTNEEEIEILSIGEEKEKSSEKLICLDEIILEHIIKFEFYEKYKSEVLEKLYSFNLKYSEDELEKIEDNVLLISICKDYPIEDLLDKMSDCNSIEEFLEDIKNIKNINNEHFKTQLDSFRSFFKIASIVMAKEHLKKKHGFYNTLSSVVLKMQTFKEILASYSYRSINLLYAMSLNKNLKKLTEKYSFNYPIINYKKEDCMLNFSNKIDNITSLKFKKNTNFIDK